MSGANVGYSPAQTPAASATVASIRDGLTANPSACWVMNTRQLKEFCNRFAGAKKTLYGEPSNILVYSVGGKTFAYFKTSDPEKWRFSTKVTRDRFVELTDYPGVKPARYRGRYHWITIVEVPRFPASYLTELVEWSYQKALASLSKAKQIVIRTSHA